MTCKYTIQSEEGTSYCMLAEGAVKKLIEVEKFVKAWLPILEEAGKYDARCFNIAEDLRRLGL